MKVEARPPQPGELAGGSFWALLRRNEGYVLDYVSGEISGARRWLRITDAKGESLRLKPEDALATLILTSYGEG